jgi:dipeptidase
VKRTGAQIVLQSFFSHSIVEKQQALVYNVNGCKFWPLERGPNHYYTKQKEVEIMACTTILVGKNASYDGSTMVARNDDCGSDSFTVKKFVTISPQEQAQTYKSVISHLTIKLPPNPMRITATPNVIPGKGIWAACGINEVNVAMSATETITSNARVLGADPMVEYQKATADTQEKAGGIGEEDIVYIVLPYIHSAREGVERLGALLEKYGTYEKNGIAFQDVNEIWWLDTIGGHHWIARRVPDDVYMIMANQFGTDSFDLQDALTTKQNYMCSADMKEFIADNHLALNLDGGFNPRDAFGSHEDSDRIYNTPRVWSALRILNPNTKVWDGPAAEYRPTDDNLPCSMVPEKKITVEDVKYVLSSHFQGTPYDPYKRHGDLTLKGAYRVIGISRTTSMSVTQLRPNLPKEYSAIEWVCFASNVFNTLVPFYTNVRTIPNYMSGTTKDVSTDSFYWNCRLIAAMTDASYSKSLIHVERYQLAVQSKNHELLKQYDEKLSQEEDAAKGIVLREEANQAITTMVKKETADVLNKVLFELSMQMKNAFSRSDA